MERVDAIVVGARCAGSAAATALARAGRRVVALDRVGFPADTISTHLLWPGGIAELKALGALERVQGLGAPQLPVAFGAAAGIELRTGYSPVDGIDYALCVRRPGLDSALVETARAAGADVRERAKVTDLVWEDGRVAGVRCEDEGGEPHELRAPLVIGADGRRSTVARLVGADRPYRAKPSGRACYYGYWEDGRPDWRDVAAQWREGAELGTAFPCDGDLTLVLLQPPVARVAAFQEDLEGAYRRTVASIPGLAQRLTGGALVSKVRSATGIESYFRRSCGPGWALAGDAGHFKDPVTAQGIRDALRYGRLLGEAAAPLLEEPAALDAALARWEREREQDCLEVYQWTNILARGEPMSSIEIELYRRAQRDPQLAQQMVGVFARSERPSQFISPSRAAGLAVRALVRRGARPTRVLRETARELQTALADRRERIRAAV
jgi:flavin-dependent dehydrogenase